MTKSIITFIWVYEHRINIPNIDKTARKRISNLELSEFYVKQNRFKNSYEYLWNEACDDLMLNNITQLDCITWNFNNHTIKLLTLKCFDKIAICYNIVHDLMLTLSNNDVSNSMYHQHNHLEYFEYIQQRIKQNENNNIKVNQMQINDMIDNTHILYEKFESQFSAFIKNDIKDLAHWKDLLLPICNELSTFKSTNLLHFRHFLTFVLIPKYKESPLLLKILQSAVKHLHIITKQ